MAQAITPARVPQQGLAGVLARLDAAGLVLDRTQHPLFIVGVRGYYRDTMGVVGKNDRGLYDDALFVVSPNGLMAFNANTDPSSYRKATKDTRGMATLVPGLYFAWVIGQHKGYRALQQIGGPVTVARDGESALDTGYFGINGHRGSVHGTSSEGCQTVVPTQWPSFIALVESEARRLFPTKWQKQIIPYALVVEPGAEG